jgi:predicted alpha/beta-fold hydrolase
MFEKIITFKYGNENIYGIIHEPQQNYLFDKKIMIVFLHGWAGYRVGPHNMLVEIARSLSEKGFYCCRFDFRGRGFSDGSCELTTTQTMLADLEVVLLEIREKYKPYHIILLGICIGAKLAIYYSKNGSQKINNVIEISSSLLVETNKNLELKIKKIKYMSISYFYKLLLRETWNKIFTNQINYKLIVKRIIDHNSKKNLDTKSIKPIVSIKPHLENASDRSDFNNNSENKSDISFISEVSPPFSNFSGQILSIHGEYDPEFELALKQIKQLCKKYNIDHSFSTIDKANHNFYSFKWKKDIIEIINKWLDSLYLQE